MNRPLIRVKPHSMFQTAHRRTQADRSGKIRADKSRHTQLLYLCNFIRGGLVPETGWGVPEREREDRKKEAVWKKVITAAPKADE